MTEVKRRYEMKKIFCALFLALMLSFPAFAAESFVVTSDDTYARTDRGRPVSLTRILVLTATAAASADGNMTLTINANTSNVDSPLVGWRLYALQMMCNHGGTELDGDVDVDVYTPATGRLDLLEGAGSNFNGGTDKTFPFWADGLGVAIPVTGDIVVVITNNGTNNATCPMNLILRD
jgi:hypothetical protein